MNVFVCILSIQSCCFSVIGNELSVSVHFLRVITVVLHYELSKGSLILVNKHTINKAPEQYFVIAFSRFYTADFGLPIR